MEDVWRPRIVYLKEIEKEFGLTLKKKLQEKNKRRYDNPYHKVDGREQVSGEESIRELIYFGKSILDFYLRHVR